MLISPYIYESEGFEGVSSNAHSILRRSWCGFRNGRTAYVQLEFAVCSTWPAMIRFNLV